MRKRQPPFHKERYIYDTFVTRPYDYPKTISTFPPGKWGRMDPELAWKWYHLGAKLSTFSSLDDRLQFLYENEQNMWYHALDCPLNFPHVADFAQFLTRTAISSAAPSPVLHCPLGSKELSALSEQLQALLEVRLRASKGWKMAALPDLLDCALRWLSPVCAHLQDIQVDERAALETFLKRSGYDPLENKESPDLTVLDEDLRVKFRIRSRTLCQIRSRAPLPPFFPPEEVPTSDNVVPNYNYDPAMFDLHPVDCHGINSFPLHPTFHSREFLTSKAGYWPVSHFYPGDPCQFGLVAVLPVPQEAFLSSLQFGDEVKDQLITSHCLSEGILAGFTWTSAQAWNRGFSFYEDISEPVCSRLILTDGRTFRFLAFQLNSLAALARGTNSGLPVNQAWLSEPYHLYEAVDSDSGCVTGWNEETLRNLLSCLAAAPVPLEMDPSERFLNLVGEPRMERPPPPRLFTQTRPHPNSTFYMKSTSRREVLEDIRKTFPGIGRLPGRFEEVAEAERRLAKFKKGRYKTPKPPLKM